MTESRRREKALEGVESLRGATGSGAHTDFEEVEVASIERGAIRAAVFIHRLTR